MKERANSSPLPPTSPIQVAEQTIPDGMNLYLTRDGQTFGPYTVEQAREYLNAGQFLEQDFALFEGQTEWQSLGQLLASAELPQPVQEAPLAETLSAAGQSRTPVASSSGDSIVRNSRSRSHALSSPTQT